jgi:hypothetical protein
MSIFSYFFSSSLFNFSKLSSKLSALTVGVTSSMGWKKQKIKKRIRDKEVLGTHVSDLSVILRIVLPVTSPAPPVPPSPN